MGIEDPDTQMPWDSKYTTIHQVVDAVRDREIELRRQDQEKERGADRETGGEKRHWERKTKESSKRGKVSRNTYSTESRRDDGKWCEKCLKKHV